ncbi:methylglyoxal synthase [Desulforamulus ruminis]|uniref:Methylglyoxal synthase n=1 Tax=Desulforamulus ruminis (strain ATCC 23193 / DSM 2154 / NCIMB 8452 / DL) TaxID=696281 RepID=F6DUI4_DESRL|nr:methylglyoxal synthase [Desulforamulus ruminis]AEG59051.1 methylglyoxal synthase [Desulforamulus ruminis DSM 2154]
MLRIALIAHDAKKQQMIDLVAREKEIFCRCELVATGTTGELIRSRVGIQISTVLSGPLGGDQQIGSRIACQTLDMVIFFRDPLTAQPHEPDVSALLRLCDVHNIPVATNWSSAEILLEHVKRRLGY